MFDTLEGNNHIKKYLSRMIQNDRVPSLLLFSGSKDGDQYRFAELFAKKLCKADKLPHPDIRIYHPEGKIGMHSIDSMRQMSDEVYLPPYNSPYKVFIICEAERMLPSSANAVLKTFEEPAPKSVILLTSSAPEQLLPTVLSRCQTIRLHEKAPSENATQKEEGEIETLVVQALAEKKIHSYRSIFPLVSALSKAIEQSQKKVGEALRESLESPYLETIPAAQQQMIDKEVDGMMTLHQQEEAQRIFNVILSWYRDLHLLAAKAPERLLYNKKHLAALKMTLAQGSIASLEAILSIIRQVKLSLERSTPLSSVLENLFLQLQAAKNERIM